MTMVAEIESLVDTYRLWLRQKTAVRDINGSWVEITTPFIDRHNDALQIYAKRSGEGYLLTDDSQVINDLESSGCNLQTAKRRNLLKITLAGFGVKLNENNALEVKATPETFAARKHDLVQAMLAVNDLFYLAQPVVESLFFEDVAAWLDSADVRYIPNVKFTGITGYDHQFHFGIPKSRREPERIVEAVNRPTKEGAADLIFRWTDTREARPSDARAYAVLNDREHSVPPAVIDALRNYGIEPVPWNLRAQAEAKLAA
ncbi:MAG TPA: DUF1829 domain-containing protein [Acidobacteriaceae bacterium]